jgi:cyclohexanone monooxygenase
VAAVRNGPFGAGSIAFIKLLEDWRAEGSLKGLELN